MVNIKVTFTLSLVITTIISIANIWYHLPKYQLLISYNFVTMNIINMTMRLVTFSNDKHVI